MSSPAADARSAPSFAIVLLSVAAFASAANMRVLDPLLVQLGQEFHVTAGAASIASTVFLFANGVFVLVHGPFGDRHGKMPVIAIACVAAALCCLMSALSISLGMLAGARFLTGVTGSAIIPLAIAWLGDNVSYDKRQATLARFLTGQTLGLMTGAAMGGALGDWLGWRSVFWVLCAIYLAAGAALFAVMRARPDVARPGARAPGSMVSQMLGVLRRPWARTVIIVVALEGGVFWGCFTFVGTDCTCASAWALPPSALQSQRSGAAASSTSRWRTTSCACWASVAWCCGAAPALACRSRCWRWRPMRSLPSPPSC